MTPLQLLETEYTLLHLLKSITVHVQVQNGFQALMKYKMFQDGKKRAIQVFQVRGAKRNMEYILFYLLKPDLVYGAERHDQHGHQQVRHGQAEDQVVGHVLQVALKDDGGDDKDVAWKR